MPSTDTTKALVFCVFYWKPTPCGLSGWRDSNSRPPAPKAGALTGLRYTPRIKLILLNCGAKIVLIF